MHLSDYASDLSDSEKSQIRWAFADVSTSILHLFMCVSSGIDWRDFYDIIVPTGPVKCAVFLYVIFFFSVAIWNIVTSTFVEKAFKLAQPDIDSLLLEKTH